VSGALDDVAKRVTAAAVETVKLLKG